jgi:hypothetical protein
MPNELRLWTITFAGPEILCNPRSAVFVNIFVFYYQDKYINKHKILLKPKIFQIKNKKHLQNTLTKHTKRGGSDS